MFLFFPCFIWYFYVILFTGWLSLSVVALSWDIFFSSIDSFVIAPHNWRLSWQCFNPSIDRMTLFLSMRETNKMTQYTNWSLILSYLWNNIDSIDSKMNEFFLWTIRGTIQNWFTSKQMRKNQSDFSIFLKFLLYFFAFKSTVYSNSELQKTLNIFIYSLLFNQ